MNMRSFDGSVGFDPDLYIGFDFKRPIANSGSILLKIRGRESFERWRHYHLLQSFFLRTRSMGRPHVPATPQATLYPIFHGIHHNSFWFYKKHSVSLDEGHLVDQDSEHHDADDFKTHMDAYTNIVSAINEKIQVWVRKALHDRRKELERTGEYGEANKEIVAQIKKLIDTKDWQDSPWVGAKGKYDHVSNYFLGFYKPNQNSGQWFCAMHHLTHFFEYFGIQIIEDVPFVDYLYDFLYIASEKLNTIMANTRAIKQNDFTRLPQKLKDEIDAKMASPSARLDVAYENWLLKALFGLEITAVIESPDLQMCKYWRQKEKLSFELLLYQNAMNYSAYRFGEKNYDRALPLEKNFPTFSNIVVAALDYPFYVYSDYPKLCVAQAVREMNLYKPNRIALKEVRA